MAENAIEILIDVLTAQGITSLDDLTKALSTAYDAAGDLSVGVDELDGALSTLTKTGLGSRDMAAGLVTAMEDAGIVFPDAGDAVDVLTGSLEKMGVASKGTTTSIELLNKANEELIETSSGAAGSVKRQGAAVETLGVKSAATASAIKGLEVGAASSAITYAAAIDNLGAGYVRLTGLAELATPALMKAATWAGVGLAGLAYEGIKQYTQFNKLITQTITQAGEAPSKMGFLTNLAEMVAKSTGQNLDDVANSIYRAASGTASWNAGLGATKKQLSDIVDTVSKLNVVGGIASGAESEQSSRVITALINSNIRGVGRNPLQAAALVNAVVGSGDIRYSDLVPAVGRGLLASAVANNLSAKDALAWVDTLTSQGTTGSVAGNYVKTGINLLAHPSAQGVQALAMLGIKPGELENLMTGPGGLTSALSTLKSGMTQLKPSDMAKFFYHEAGEVYPGGSGLAGAVAKLQTWSAGELSPKFISDWEKNQLTPQEQTQATDLILTKAFGGSKQFATIAGVINNLNLFKGIESHIGEEDSTGYFNAQYRRTAATPSQQFRRMGQNLLVDLVNAGKTLTPIALTFGHIMTGVIDGLSKFKGVIYGFATMAAVLLGAVGIGKIAELGSHLSPLIGAGYNRLGMIMGKDSKFTTAMIDEANGKGKGFRFLNIYDSKKTKLLSKLGGESINAQGEFSDTSLSPDGQVLNSTGLKQVALLEKIAINTSVGAEEGAVGGGSGFARGGKVGGAVEAAAQREASMATYTPRDAMYIGSGANALDSQMLGMAEGTIFQDAKTGRWTKILAGGRRTFISNDEAFKSGAMNDATMAKIGGQPALGPGTEGSADFITQRGASGVSDSIALPTESDLGGVDMGLGQFGPGLEGGLSNAAVKLLPEAGDGILAGLGEMAGGLMGGPVGMMAMMAAPTIIGAMAPLFGKLGSLLGSWLGGGSSKAYVSNVKNPLDINQASARVQKALKAYRQFQTEIKNKAGKEEWVLNEAALRADPNGYATALGKLQRARGTYSGSLGHAGSTFNQAFNDVYGRGNDTLTHDLALAKGYAAGRLVTMYTDHGDYTYKTGVGSLSQLQNLEKTLPGPVKQAINKAIKHNGTGTTYALTQDFQAMERAINQRRNWASRVYTTDFSTASLQDQMKYFKTGAFANEYGFGSSQTSLDTNLRQLKNYLGNKHTTASRAAEYLKYFTQPDRSVISADNRALLAKNLPPEAKKYFDDQKKEAEESLAKTDALIREIRDAAKDTHLAGDSVEKLARQNAAALAASGLTAPQIGAAVAAALSPYLKSPKVGGTSTSVTTTSKVPVSAGGFAGGSI